MHDFDGGREATRVASPAGGIIRREEEQTTKALASAEQRIANRVTNW
jgi:hypothetical protein